MPYKTILVHVDETTRVSERIKAAADLAITENAHLVGLSMSGLSRFIYQNARIPDADPNFSAHLDFLRERAKNALVAFETIAREKAVPGFEARMTDDDAEIGLCLHARYADLVVIGQTSEEQDSPTLKADFPQNVILNAGRPVLVIPYIGQFDSIGKRVLIAWDASKEATRAVTNALPLLIRADIVQVAVFNPNPYSNVHGEQPGSDIALFLARHGVKIELSIHHTERDAAKNTKLDVGNALLSLANDLSSDLLVMGAYGHSRFRETMLGGVTRTIMQTMTLPVLMSH
jgi:nucleotide-binding universal stress UspA family protein